MSILEIYVEQRLSGTDVTLYVSRYILQYCIFLLLDAKKLNGMQAACNLIQLIIWGIQVIAIFLFYYTSVQLTR